MVKDFFRGFGYTIGKIIAFLFIGILSAFLLSKVDISKIPFKQLIMKTVFINAKAESVSGSGYLGQKVCFMGSCTDGIDSNVSQQLFFPTNTYTIINGYTGSVGNRSYTYVRLLYLYFTNSTFSANNTYKIVFTIDTGTGINYETRTLTYCGNSADVSRCSISWNDLYDSSLNHYTATIYYTPTTTVSSPTFIIGSSTGNHYFLYNSTSTNQGVRIVSMDVTVDNTGTGAIINNNNQNTQNIINSQTEINNSINDISDTLNDTTQPNTSNFFNNLGNYAPSMTPITDLLNMPYNLINRFLNGFNGSCSSINLGSLYGTTLVLPCIDLGSLLGSQLWGIIDILFVGIMCLNIGELLIHDFNSLLTLNDEFESTYTPKHIYQPKHGRY